MADYFGAATDLISGAGGFIAGQAGAAAGAQAASTYTAAANIALASGQIKGAMVQRNIWQTLGGISAAASKSGLATNTGNAQDLIRDSAHQGAIAKAVVTMNSEVDYNALKAQAASAAAQGKASGSGGFLKAAGGILGAIGSIF
jgi:hypothetical protein